MERLKNLIGYSFLYDSLFADYIVKDAQDLS